MRAHRTKRSGGDRVPHLRMSARAVGASADHGRTLRSVGLHGLAEGAMDAHVVNSMML